MTLISPLSCMGGVTIDTPEELKLGSALRLNYASSDKTLSDARNFFLSTVETKANYSLTPDLKIAMQVRMGATMSPVRHAELELPYVYLDIKTSAVDFRLGKQIIAWGRNDALNPTDVVTPRDYTTLLPFDEDERTGIWGVRSNYYMTQELMVSLFYSFQFEPSILPFTSHGAQKFDFGSRSFDEQQIGLRIDRSNEDFDFSVSVFHGRSLLGQAEKIDMLLDGGSVTHFRYPKISMVGADFAKNFGKYGFRVEGSYVRPENVDRLLDIGMKPYGYVVAGADRTFFNDLNINVQLFGRWTKYGTNGDTYANSDEQSIASLNKLIFVQTDKSIYGAAFRITNQWLNQTLVAELFIQHYFNDGSTYLHPMLRYAVSDKVKFTLGALWYFGDEGSLFGTLKKNNGVFSELRYSF